MSAKWTRVGCGLLIFAAVLGCAFPFIFDNRQESRRNVVITIDLDRRQEFFDQLRKFAKANGFAIQIDTSSSSNEQFQIYMHREDIIIDGINGTPLNEYQLGFSDLTARSPAPDSTYDNLMSELKRYVSEVPGTTFLTTK